MLLAAPPSLTVISNTYRVYHAKNGLGSRWMPLWNLYKEEPLSCFSLKRIRDIGYGKI